jgi:hypothetical protein
MNIDRAVLAFAGIVVILGALLALTVNIWWIALVLFAGANMIQASMTGFCPAAKLFRMFGLPPGRAFR